MVDFICQEVRVLKTPVFGDIYDIKATKDGKRTFKNKILSINAAATTNEGKDSGRKLNVSEESNVKFCCFCKMSNHRILTCNEFSKLSNAEKCKEVFKNRLCFDCLQGGYLSKECSQRQRCKKCQGNHPTIMHADKMKYPRK